MKREIELLAPGGDIDSIKAAIAAGANAVYCGLNKFNARNRAANITFDDLNGILRLAHRHGCEVFITLNIVVVDREIPDLIRLLNKLVNTRIDGVIIQDLGLFYLISKYFKSLKIHASTQLTTHNQGQIRFLSALNATRVNLCRELNIDEINSLTSVAHQNNLLTEVFVHGSYCISFSGICYMSSLQSGNSGNRGRCSQPCRDEYLETPAGKKFPLNLKDNSAYHNLRELFDAGVDSIKIEGRIKKFHYVYTVVDTYRKQLTNLYENNQLNGNDSILYKVFNRDFSNAFLMGNINKQMFIDNPRNYSAIYRSELMDGDSADNLERGKKEAYDESIEITAHAKSKIDKLSVEKAPVQLSVSGKAGNILEVLVNTPDATFVICSKKNLVSTTKNSLDYESLYKRFKAINDTEYYIELIELDNLIGKLFIPFKELTAITRKIVFILNGENETLPAIDIPGLKCQPDEVIKPTLSVLISSSNDLNLCDESSAEIYFQLPNSLKNCLSEYVELFTVNRELIPWFPSILIGDDFDAAVDFLDHVQSKLIVTNNTGIAFEANRKGIAWIAGPYLNMVNSYGLLCLKENFNCAGSFISNEINRQQIAGIKRPQGFKLYYSIYHPIVLMTSRQCLFHPVIGCNKDRMDDQCIRACNKSTSITNLKDNSFIIEKSKGSYHHIYNNINFLNTDIVTDLPDLFSSFFIDLRDIKTNTKSEHDKASIIQLFENHIQGNTDSTKQLKQIIQPSTNIQYKKGI